MSIFNRLTYIICALSLLTINNMVFAEQLFPFRVGDRYELINSGSSAPVFVDMLQTVTHDNQQYVSLINPSGQAQDVRSTEAEVYIYNPNGDDILLFLKAPVGTIWYTHHPDLGQNDWTVNEIVAIENITFTITIEGNTVTYDSIGYTKRSYECEDRDNPTPENLNNWWEETVVPGVGMVKMIDHWGVTEPDLPDITELVSINMIPPYAPSPASDRSYDTKP